MTYYRLPLPHHKHMKSTNMLERLNQELKRRTHVVRIFPNAASCLRLVRALAVETHENWLEATRYLNMEHLDEHKKERLRSLDMSRLTAAGGGARLRPASAARAPAKAQRPWSQFAEEAGHYFNRIPYQAGARVPDRRRTPIDGHARKFHV